MSQVELILIALYELSEKENPVSYEELVVTAFKNNPDVFGLKKYPQYPDSFTVNKRLYLDLKEKGYCQFKNKKVSITKYGKEIAEQLITNKKQTGKKKGRLSAAAIREYDRLLNLKGFKIFLENKEKTLIDIDVYEFYYITVRTPLNDIKRKKKQLESFIDNVEENSLSMINQIKDYKQKIDNTLSQLIDEHNSAKN